MARRSWAAAVHDQLVRCTARARRGTDAASGATFHPIESGLYSLARTLDCVGSSKAPLSVDRNVRAPGVVTELLVSAPPTPHPIVLLVNPAAGRGRAAHRAQEVERALQALGPVERCDTRAPGDEARIARDAAARGAGVLAIVGGDGSISHAVRGLLSAPHAPPLAIFGAGTGNDFAKSLDTPVHDIAAMTARIAAGGTRTVDVGYVNDVPFVNAAGFGFDVHVLERMRAPMLLRGTAAYVATALRALSAYPGLRVQLPHETERRQRLMLVVANGRYFGGAFHIAPQATLDDGQLDLVAIDNAPTVRRLSLFAAALRGAHLRAPEVYSTRASSYRARFDQPPAFEADGELHQAQDVVVEVRVRPGALRVIV